MSYDSSSSQKFLGTLAEWLSSQGEILLMIRYSHAAGSKDFEFFTAFDALTQRLKELPPKTCIIAFREAQLPIRGIVAESFIAECLRSIPDGSEYLAVERNITICGKASWFRHRAGETHDELRADLADSIGQEVAVGLYPPWLQDNADVISAVVPDQLGRVVTGAY